MAELHTDVLICGAGAAGFTLAIDLARRSVDFVLVDKAAQPFVGSRGKGIQPRSQEIFDDLGVVDRIAAVGGEYPCRRFYTTQGLVDGHATEMSRPPLGLARPSKNDDAMVGPGRRDKYTSLLASLNIMLESPVAGEASTAECADLLRNSGFGGVEVRHLIGPISAVYGFKPGRLPA